MIRVAGLEWQTLGVRAIAQGYWKLTVCNRPKNVCSQDQSIIRTDAYVTVDSHASRALHLQVVDLASSLAKDVAFGLLAQERQVIDCARQVEVPVCAWKQCDARRSRRAQRAAE